MFPVDVHVPPIHCSAVHAFPSLLQLVMSGLFFVQLPVDGSHVLQGFEQLFFVPVQKPLLHVSLLVQALPSSHDAPEFFGESGSH